MSNSIQKFTLEDNIRFYYFRYRGSISKIIEGLKKLPGYKDTNIEPVYVQKVIKKFEKQRKNDIGIHVCYNFMEYLHMGVQERLCRYQQWLDELEDKSSVLVSTCHKVPVGEIRDINGEISAYKCLEPKCGQITPVILLENTGVYNLRMRILDEMRKDEIVLLKAIKDLGFSIAEPQNVTKINQYNFHSASNSKQINNMPSEEDQKLLRGIDGMDPRSREKMIKDLEKEIVVDTNFEQEKDNEKSE